MQDPLITISIPTRERANALAYILKTLTSQVTEDCEFLVYDDAVAAHTHRKRRVRYSPQGRKTKAMSIFTNVCSIGAAS
jgi:hypothetical protein